MIFYSLSFNLTVVTIVKNFDQNTQKTTLTVTTNFRKRNSTIEKKNNEGLVMMTSELGVRGEKEITLNVFCKRNCVIQYDTSIG
jgi:hypothetical protein